MSEKERVCLLAQSLQLRLALRDPMECSPPGSSLQGIVQASTLQWVAMASSRGSSDPGIEPGSLTSPALAGGFFTTNTTWGAPRKSHPPPKTGRES